MQNVEMFWSMVATVIPVIALAVVVELRAYGKRWHEQPAWATGPQTLFVAVFLISAVITENYAVHALATPESPPDAAVQLAKITISYGMAILVFVPAFELCLRVSTPLLSVAMTLNPCLLARVFVLRRRARRLHRQSQKLDKRREQALTLSEELIAESELQIDQSRTRMDDVRQAMNSFADDDPRKEVGDKVLRANEEWERTALERMNEGAKLIANIPPSTTEETARKLAELERIQEQIATISKDQRKALRDLLTATEYGLNPLIPTPPTENDVPATPRRRGGTRSSLRPHTYKRRRKRRHART